jgi:hypothetical protein
VGLRKGRCRRQGLEGSRKQQRVNRNISSLGTSAVISSYTGMGERLSPTNGDPLAKFTTWINSRIRPGTCCLMACG